MCMVSLFIETYKLTLFDICPQQISYCFMYVSTYFIHIVCINCLYDPHTPPFTVTGLLDYQLTVQLRSLRKEHWDDQFRHVDCREGVFDEGYAVFSVVKPDQRVKINTEEFVFPWKTDIFKGKVKVHMF